MSKMSWLIFVLFLIPGGCEQRSPECREVINVSREQGYPKFRSYSLEKQLDVYLCAMRVEPPDVGLASEIAKNGESALPTVLQRLRTTEREIDQQELIYLLEVMSDQGLLRGRKDVIADINNVVDNMKIPQVKQYCEEKVKRIRLASGVK